jgi:hypothetical protein
MFLCKGIGVLFRVRLWFCRRALVREALECVIRIDWDFRGFGLILQELVQVSIAAMWSWRILLAVNGFFWLVHTAVSSANSLVFVRGSSETGKSLQYVM